MSLGPKFSLPTNTLNFEEFIASIEAGITVLGSGIKILIKNKICKIANIIPIELTNLKKSRTNYYIKQSEKFINSNKNLLILTAGKCNKTVIIYNEEYMKKCMIC